MAKQLSCGVEFMRGVLLFLNILFILVGLAILGIGIYMKVDNNFSSILSKLTGESGFEAQSFGYLAFALIGGGVFTLLIALFGCMGTLWHNRCLLYMYAIILAILMIVELVAFIMAFVYKGQLKKTYEDALNNVLQDALKGNKKELLSAFTELEIAMKCCGVFNISDYRNYPNETSEYCNKNPTADGCSTAIINFLNKNLPIIGGTLGGVLLLELFGLIAAIVLAVALKHAPDDSYSSSPGKVLSNIVPGRRNY